MAASSHLVRPHHRGNTIKTNTGAVIFQPRTPDFAIYRRFNAVFSQKKHTLVWSSEDRTSISWGVKPLPPLIFWRKCLFCDNKKPGSKEPGREPGQGPVRDGTPVPPSELADLVFVVDPQAPIHEGHDAPSKQAAGQHEAQPEPQQKQVINHRTVHHNLLSQSEIAAVWAGGRTRQPPCPTIGGLGGYGQSGLVDGPHAGHGQDHEGAIEGQAEA